MPRIRITNLDDVRLTPYRNLRLTKDCPRVREPSFIAEGRWMVERLLDSVHDVESILVASKVADEWIEKVPSHVPLFEMEQDSIKQLVGYDFHRGVMAHGKRNILETWSVELDETALNQPELSSLEPKSDRRELLPRPKPIYHLACPRIANPENMGSLIRSAAALGAASVIVGPGCADPFSRRSIRVSAGNVFRIPIVEPSDFAGEIERLGRQRHYQVAATTIPGPDCLSLNNWHPSNKTILLVGAEDFGLTREELILADCRVTIPMAAGTDSLNVAVSAAIVLHHLQTKAISSPPPESI